MDNPKRTSFLPVLLVILGVIVLLCGGILVYQFCFQGKSEKKETTKVSEQTSNILGEKLTTYSDSKYNYSFEYPATWQKNLEMNNPDVLSYIEFSDPDRLQEIKISVCLVQQSSGLEPTEECKTILQNLTPAQKQKLNQLMYQKNIIVNVYPAQTNTTLDQWLTQRYQKAGTELQNYKPGKEIEVASRTGYVSSTSCCADYMVSYVIQNNGYIYEIGTNYKDGEKSDGTNSLLDEITATFKFLS